MRIRERLTTAAGLTLLETAILMVLAGMIAMGSYEYYTAAMELKEARIALAEARGNLGVAADELQRQLRGADRRIGSGPPLRVASTHDTLVIYASGKDPGTVDTLRYFVNHFDAPPSLIKQVNSATPAVFARAVDSVLFIASAGRGKGDVSVVLVSTPPDDEATLERKRLGFNVALGER